MKSRANLHFNTPNPKIDFENWKLEVVTKPTPLPEPPVVVGLNSFGFGGTNAHLVDSGISAAARQAKCLSANLRSRSRKRILLISGHTEAALQAVARTYVDLLRSTESAPWEELCAAVATCRSPLRLRLAVAASSKDEAAGKLESYLAGQTLAGAATGTSAAPLSPAAFLYSGNGPQWWGMGRELLAENAIFRAEVEAVDAIFAPLAGWSLIDEMRRPENESRIGLTEIAQPMLFVEQLGLTQVLRASGVQASAVLGHSVGEVAAAWASGALTREQATRVIFHRSMEQGKTAGSGRMAALGVGPDDALKAIEQIPGWLELAAVNSPQSVTVAGDPLALEKLAQATISSGKFARVLPLNYPFHTKAMEPIRDGLVAALKDLAPGASTVPFISTVTGSEIAGTELDAEYWYRNVREPVRFHDAVAHLTKEHGVLVFVEIGPHPVLKDYVTQSSKAIDIPVAAIPTLRRPGSKGPEPESDNIWSAICACHANGAGDLDTLYTRPTPPPALPLYPWQHSRHWRGSTILPDVFSPIERDHPLLGYRVPSADGLWENILDTNQLQYLKDHVVQHSVLFPAAGYIELSLSAGQIALGKGLLDVEDFEIIRPLVIPPHGDPIVQTSVDIKDGEVEIRSRLERDSTEWVRHARGRLSRSDARPPDKAANLAEISARMPHAVSAAEHYAGSSHRGLDYGPAFQGVRNILLTCPKAESREALAEIDLPFLENGGLTGYLSHPSLFDSCIQVIITLIGQIEKRNCSTIPVHIGRVRSIAPLTSRVFCHVIMRRESERSAVADFRVMDQDGNLLLTIDEARCQKVDFGHGAASPLTSEWWRPDTVAPALTEPAPLPAPAEIFSSLTAEIATISQENHRSEFYADLRPQFERLAGAYAAAAIAALNPGDAAFDVSRLARKAGVKRDQIPLLTKLVSIAEQDGQLVASGSTRRWNKDRTPESPDALWRELFQTHSRYYAELLLLAEAGDHLAARLRGEDSGELPGALLDQLFDTSPYQKPYNQIARAAIEKLVASWPADRPMRILEIAGAGGGLAAWLLPVLPSERADYLFTDPSETSIGRAEHRLAAHRFARFAALDLTRDLIEQGQPAGYFDLVIGSHALASTSDSGDLLERLKAVMAPGALLLAVQPNGDRFTDLVLGQQPASWQTELAAAGFETPVALSDAAACPTNQTPQQTVLLARLATVAAVKPAAKNDATPRRWLLVFEGIESASAFGQALVQSLTASGQSAAAESFTASTPDLKAAIAAALERHPAEEIVFVSGLDTGSHDFLATQQHRSLTALYLVQALEEVRQGTPRELTFVTRGAFPTANGQGSLDPGQAPVWGLGRVIGNEHTALNIRLIDLHSTVNGAAEASWLAAELLRRDAETEVQLFAGHRFVNRERLNTLTDEARIAHAATPEAFALDFHAHGGLDSLHLRAADAPRPRPIRSKSPLPPLA